VKFQKLMWRNMMKSTKSKKVSVLRYSIDSQPHPLQEYTYSLKNKKKKKKTEKRGMSQMLIY
jgi:hypothetical protein